VITTGGTGFTGRDVTPEAVEPLFEKKMDGFATMFLLVSERKIGTSAIQTRATAGVANATYIFCLRSPARAAMLGRNLYRLITATGPAIVEILPRPDDICDAPKQSTGNRLA
jgi:molybdenum cofactor biosynthesis protein B